MPAKCQLRISFSVCPSVCMSAFIFAGNNKYFEYLVFIPLEQHWMKNGNVTICHKCMEIVWIKYSSGQPACIAVYSWNFSDVKLKRKRRNTLLTSSCQRWMLFSSLRWSSEKYCHTPGVGAALSIDKALTLVITKEPSETQRYSSHVSYDLCTLWQDLSHHAIIFYLVTLTLKFDLLLKNFNLTLHIH